MNSTIFPVQEKNEKYTLHNSNRAIYGFANNTLNSKDLRKFSIEVLPLEILYLIIERLDAISFVNCLHVSKKWKSITLSIADMAKNNQRWKSIFELYHEEETFKIKSNKLLSYKELFANSLQWNHNFLFSLKDTCLVNHIKKINIYRDNVIVINNVGVKYYDVKTHEIKRELEIAQCFDFNERDEMIIRGTKAPNVGKIPFRLFLYGKKDPDDDEFETAVQAAGYNDVHRANSILIGGVRNYMLEKNSCYVVNTFNVLSCYTWKSSQAWNIHRLGRFYVNCDDNPYAMNVLNSDVFVLIKWGQLINFCYEKRNFQQVCRIRMPQEKNLFKQIKLVHKYCVVIGVPDNCEFRITRLRNNEGYIQYRFECPKLTCATQHGEMLFLGFSDGKIELFNPRSISRENMFKRRIHISDFKAVQIDPEDLIVVSIDVYEDYEKHHLFIATRFSVYHLVITHPDDICVWDNIPEKVVYYKYPIRTKCLL